uniref:Uncharacterized protein n=1 Tax=Coccidioides posadasii RMSCC 3488 TaxID=454284 RepID=A0A0J6FB10_COCPO|nr:hypothetical protein CPAG_06513 [Coccidioides posadasii RMSCC 3488]
MESEISTVRIAVLLRLSFLEGKMCGDWGHESGLFFLLPIFLMPKQEELDVEGEYSPYRKNEISGQPSGNVYPTTTSFSTENSLKIFQDQRALFIPSTFRPYMFVELIPRPLGILQVR